MSDIQIRLNNLNDCIVSELNDRVNNWNTEQDGEEKIYLLYLILKLLQ